MDAVEFLKALGRLCNNYLCGDNCPLIDSCDDESDDGYVRKVQIVEQWAKEHPVKTRQSEFLKMFPNAQKSLNGVLDICPRKFEPEKYKSATPDKVCVNGNADDEYHCDECCRDFWLKEIG